MSLEEHLPNGDKTPLAIQLEATESYFLAIFCVESCLKVQSSCIEFLNLFSRFLSNKEGWHPEDTSFNDHVIMSTLV
jgi:hypothetical protein